jgi:hypothetical protein
VVDPRINLGLDPNTRAPRTDEYSVGVDRELGRRLAVAAAYVHKDGANFISWTDIGGEYGVETRPLPDGRSVPVFVLLNETAARRFFLTNPKESSLTYNGLVMLVEKRRSHGWQVFASYTVSKTTGLLPSSGTNAAGAQVSTVSPPNNITFGRDPNDLTNAAGLLPNDRPHIFRMMGSVEVARRRGDRRKHAVLDRQAVGRHGAAEAAPGRSARSARTARVAQVVVAIAARRAYLAIDGVRETGARRVDDRRAQCAQRDGRRRPRHR